jgi:hypothetical protein
LNKAVSSPVIIHSKHTTSSLSPQIAKREEAVSLNEHVKLKARNLTNDENEKSSQVIFL